MLLLPLLAVAVGLLHSGGAVPTVFLTDKSSGSVRVHLDVPTPGDYLLSLDFLLVSGQFDVLINGNNVATCSHPTPTCTEYHRCLTWYMVKEETLQQPTLSIDLTIDIQGATQPCQCTSDGSCGSGPGIQAATPTTVSLKVDVAPTPLGTVVAPLVSKPVVDVGVAKGVEYDIALAAFSTSAQGDVTLWGRTVNCGQTIASSGCDQAVCPSTAVVKASDDVLSYGLRDMPVKCLCTIDPFAFAVGCKAATSSSPAPFILRLTPRTAHYQFSFRFTTGVSNYADTKNAVLFRPLGQLGSCQDGVIPRGGTTVGATQVATVSCPFGKDSLIGLYIWILGTDAWEVGGVEMESTTGYWVALGTADWKQGVQRWLDQKPTLAGRANTTWTLLGDLCSPKDICGQHAVGKKPSPTGCTCECAVGYSGKSCEECATGYVGYPLCKACSIVDHCNGHASKVTGDGTNCLCTCYGAWSGADCSVCPPQYSGSNCDECANGLVGFPACQCDTAKHCSGRATSVAPTSTGCHCSCRNQWSGADCSVCNGAYFGGTDCNECRDPSYTYPVCGKCSIAVHCSGHATSVLDGNPCKCTCANHWSGQRCEMCALPFGGTACDECATGYVGYPACTPCDAVRHCSGRATAVEAIGGKCHCQCLGKWEGEKCDRCPPQFDQALCSACSSGHVGYPECSPCNMDTCNGHATAAVVASSQCLCTCTKHWEGTRCASCPDRFVQTTCDACAEGYIDFPTCVKCDVEVHCSGHATRVTSADGKHCKCTCVEGWGGESCGVQRGVLRWKCGEEPTATLVNDTFAARPVAEVHLNRSTAKASTTSAMSIMSTPATTTTTPITVITMSTVGHTATIRLELQRAELSGQTVAFRIPPQSVASGVAPADPMPCSVTFPTAPETIPAPVVAAVGITATTVTAGSVAAAGTAASHAAQLAVVMDASCSHDSSKYHDDLPPLLHPTRMKLWGNASAGAMVGNLAMLAGSAVLGSAVLAAFLICKRKRRKEVESDHNIFTFLDAQGLLRFPSVPLFVLLFVYQGLVYSTLRLVFYPPSSTLFVMAIFALFFCLIVPASLSRYLFHNVPSKARYRLDHIPQQKWARMVVGSGEWVSAQRVNHWVNRYQSVLRAYREAYSGGVIFEFALMFLTAACRVPRVTTWRSCGNIRISLAAVHGLALIVFASVTPFVRARDNVYMIARLGLCLIGLVLQSIAFYSHDPHHWGFRVADDLFMTALAFIMVKVVADMVTEGWVWWTKRRFRLQGLEWRELDWVFADSIDNPNLYEGTFEMSHKNSDTISALARPLETPLLESTTPGLSPQHTMPTLLITPTSASASYKRFTLPSAGPSITPSLPSATPPLPPTSSI